MTETMPAKVDKRKLHVVSLGIMAEKFLCSSSKWRLLSVYKRSFYCIDKNDNIICVGLNEIGRGPFTLLCSAGDRWPAGQLKSVTYLNVVGNSLIPEGAGFFFDMQCASTWQESLHDLPDTSLHIKEDLNWLMRRATISAPQESLGWLIPAFCHADCKNTAKVSNVNTLLLHKRVIDVTHSISDDFIFSVESFADTGSTGGLERLIGLGYGLTPSGDDFLAGIVMGFHKMQRHQEAAVLARNFYRNAQGKTTTISLAFYRALAEGWVTEPHWQFLEIIGCGESAKRESLFDRVRDFGTTSGWDTLAGIVFGIGLVQRSLKKSNGYAAEAVC